MELVYLGKAPKTGRVMAIKTLALSQQFEGRNWPMPRKAGSCCPGLACSHKQNRVYRDIKPANILSGSEGEIVKTIDFGLVSITNPSKTKMGLPFDTPKLLLPERLYAQPWPSWRAIQWLLRPPPNFLIKPTTAQLQTMMSAKP